MFENAKIGDEIYCYPMDRMVTVKSINENLRFPLRLSDGCNINYQGHLFDGDVNPTYFWSKVQITPPPKPKVKVKRTVEGWINYYPAEGYCFHENEEKAFGIFSGIGKPGELKAIPATLTYEIEE